MAEYEQRDLSGALFKNKKKEKETHPDYRGTAKIAGIEYWVSAWIKKSAAGETYMSMAYQAKDEQHETKERPTPVCDDDIPF